MRVTTLTVTSFDENLISKTKLKKTASMSSSRPGQCEDEVVELFEIKRVEGNGLLYRNTHTYNHFRLFIVSNHTYQNYFSDGTNRSHSTIVFRNEAEKSVVMTRSSERPKKNIGDNTEASATNTTESNDCSEEGRKLKYFTNITD